ncbi:MAG TPA: hypothetical protein VEZ40_04440, partial [Pyrinomonadaceae bacterium]|nr:hypothetical protein [Pyrinomonadaceae bacterium]
MTRTSRLLLRLAALLLCLAFPAAEGGAQMTLEQTKVLLNRPAVQAAFAFVDKDRAETLREWIAITEINAPSGKERPRAEYIEKILRGYKLSN